MRCKSFYMSVMENCHFEICLSVTKNDQFSRRFGSEILEGIGSPPKIYPLELNPGPMVLPARPCWLYASFGLVMMMMVKMMRKPLSTISPPTLRLFDLLLMAPCLPP